MLRSYINRPSSKQTGAVAVELAVMVPVLLLLMLAIAEIGRMLFQYNTLAKTTRDAARYAASNAAFGSTGVIIADNSAGSSWSVMKSDTTNLLVCGFINCAGKTPILSDLATANVTIVSPDNQHVTVSVTYTYQPFLGIPIPTFGYGSGIDAGIAMQSSINMRAL